MHTAEQAKQLWCPMGRVGVLPKAGGPAGVNDPDVEFKTNCIADRCAMWRWAAHAPHHIRVACFSRTAEVEPQRPPGLNPTFVFSPYSKADCEPACWVEPESERRARCVGYCGLAGSPSA